jgi:hypothetical protein
MTPQGRRPAAPVSDNGSRIADHPQDNRTPQPSGVRGWHPQAPRAPGACDRQGEGHAPRRRRLLLRKDLARDDGAARVADALAHRPPKLSAHRDATPRAPWTLAQNVPQPSAATVDPPRSAPDHRRSRRVGARASATANATAPTTRATGRPPPPADRRTGEVSEDGRAAGSREAPPRAAGSGDGRPPEGLPGELATIPGGVHRPADHRHRLPARQNSGAEPAGAPGGRGRMARAGALRSGWPPPLPQPDLHFDTSAASARLGRARS